MTKKKKKKEMTQLLHMYIYRKYFVQMTTKKKKKRKENKTNIEHYYCSRNILLLHYSRIKDADIMYWNTRFSPVLSYNMNATPCEKRAVECELFLECIRKWASAESRGACAKCKTILCHQGNPILPRR